MHRKKISLIGSSDISSYIAQLILLKIITPLDIILVDIIENLVKGTAMDLEHSATIFGIDVKIKGTNDLINIKDSDIIVIAVGILRKPGMTNNDLLEVNGKIITSIGLAIKNFSPNSFVICVTNPLDLMTNILQDYSNLKNNKIIGVAGSLNAARFKTLLAKKFNVSVNDIIVTLLGSNSYDIIPILTLTNIAGFDLNFLLKTKKITKNELIKLIEETKQSENNIITLLGEKISYHTIASGIIEIIDSFLLNKKKILSCSVNLNNTCYNIKNDIFYSIPVKIGNNGVEEIIKINLNIEEQKLFDYAITCNMTLKKNWHLIKSNLNI